MKSKPRPPRDQEPEPVERDDVRVAANRCPFCHDDVAAGISVVCQDCLARHHRECWTESQGCGSCRGTHLLERPVDDARPTQDELFRAAVSREPRAQQILLGSMFCLLAGLSVVLAGFGLWGIVNAIPTAGWRALLAAPVWLLLMGGVFFLFLRSARLRLWGREG